MQCYFQPNFGTKCKIASTTALQQYQNFLLWLLLWNCEKRVIWFVFCFPNVLCSGNLNQTLTSILELLSFFPVISSVQRLSNEYIRPIVCLKGFGNSSRYSCLHIHIVDIVSMNFSLGFSYCAHVGIWLLKQVLKLLVFAFY